MDCAASEDLYSLNSEIAGQVSEPNGDGKQLRGVVRQEMHFVRNLVQDATRQAAGSEQGGGVQREADDSYGAPAPGGGGRRRGETGERRGAGAGLGEGKGGLLDQYGTGEGVEGLATEYGAPDALGPGRDGLDEYQPGGAGEEEDQYQEAGSRQGQYQGTGQNSGGGQKVVEYQGQGQYQAGKGRRARKRLRTAKKGSRRSRGRYRLV